MLMKLSTGSILAASLLLAPVFQVQGFAHCQIPCGIYDDQARLGQIAEDITTIEKGMNQINELSKDPSKNANQIVRWVQNKDEHADRIQSTVADYFLSQRVKLPKERKGKAYNQYVQKLEMLHQLTVAAMKAKQTTDLKYVKKLRNVLSGFEVLP